MNAIDLTELITRLGGTSEVARMCKVRPPSVSEWRSRGLIPADRCEQIERATNGAVTCEDLRPDLMWTRVDGHAFYRERPAYQLKAA